MQSLNTYQPHSYAYVTTEIKTWCTNIIPVYLNEQNHIKGTKNHACAVVIQKTITSYRTDMLHYFNSTSQSLMKTTAQFSGTFLLMSSGPSSCMCCLLTVAMMAGMSTTFSRAACSRAMSMAISVPVALIPALQEEIVTAVTKSYHQHGYIMHLKIY